MTKFLRKIIVLFLVVLLAVNTLAFFCYAEEYSFEVNAKGAILMEASTGKVLFEQNADEPFLPASVTKIMTLLIVMEAIDNGTIKLTDMVTTSARAASMGGSQIYLEEGEQMSVEDLIKSVVIASANDASVALAEHIAGSEEAFVALMNKRAKELDMNNTHFENTNGLDDDVTNHASSARDIAIMSRELISHKLILKYSSIWMDSVRNGAFGLTNTNRLVRFYNGATGLKTGSTSKALFCISATAERDGMSLIAVIMASPTRDIRNAEAKKLLDYGFAHYGVYKNEGANLPDLYVRGGLKNSCTISYGPFSAVLPKAAVKSVEQHISVEESVSAPVKKGDVVGSVTYLSDGKEIGKVDIVATESVDKISFFGLLGRMFRRFIIA